MINKIIETYRSLINDVDFKTYRYLYDTFEMKNRLTGLIGPRGSGKTTMMLQIIKNKIKDIDQCIYVSLDSIYFLNLSLLDFVKELYENNGVKYFFLDEVHKYPNWSQELKNIYDSFPNIKTVFSGSSGLDLIKGNYDLSRRGKIYKLNGMSFREYLYFKTGKLFDPIKYADIIEEPNKYCDTIAKTDKLKGIFKEYLEYGYYPFVFEDKDSYREKIINIINKTVYQDISGFYKLKTENLIIFMKIVTYLSTIPPGELNVNSISKHVGKDNKTIETYLDILNETGLAYLLSDNKSGGGILKGKKKIYLGNPNLYKAISSDTGFNYKKGTVRELFFINMIVNSGEKIFYSKVGDFIVKGKNFEIGGKNKSEKQISSDLKNSYVVKDDILYANKRDIPLYLFGFLY